MNNFNKEENNINEIKIEKKELLPGIILIKEYQQPNPQSPIPINKYLLKKIMNIIYIS